MTTRIFAVILSTIIQSHCIKNFYLCVKIIRFQVLIGYFIIRGNDLPIAGLSWKWVV